MSTATLDRVDFANGIDPAREYALATTPPADKFRFAENFMLAVYDPALDLGMWLHLGTCPDDFGQWEEQVLMALPGDGGFLWTRAYNRPGADRKPCGANMVWTVEEPFRSMHVRFDGIGIRTPYADMMNGRVRDAKQELFAIDLDVRALAPAWDNHVSAASGGARGSMAEQSWASEHYQQTFRATGTVRIDGRDLAFDGTGVRDHSRGQRGHKAWAFGGHNLWSAPFASGRAFGMQRMWTPDFQGTLNVGFVYVDGQFHHTDLVTPPGYLRHVALSGDPLDLVMRSPLGEHRITGVLRKTLFCTFGDPWGYHFGADLAEPRGLFVPGFAEFTWDGETGYGLAERSGPVGKLPA